MAGIQDSGWSKSLLDATRKRTVTVGLHEAEVQRESDIPTNALIGFWQEFGTSNVPERSFLRSTMDTQQQSYIQLLTTYVAASVAGGQSIDSAFDLLGFKISSDVKETIRSKIPPPNAESTIRAKGSSTPLIDTGQLLNAIDFEVR